MSSSLTGLGGLLIVVLLGAATYALVRLIKKHLRLRVGGGHHETVAAVFATVGTLYAVVLAFMVFAVWERFDATDEAVSHEAAQIVGAYRDTAVLPPELRETQRAAFRTYVNEVMDSEWSTDGQMIAHSRPDALNPLWNTLDAAEAAPGANLAALDRASENLHDVEIARHGRHLGRGGTLPSIFWLTLVGGAILTASFVVLFDLESTRIHATISALLVGSIAVMLLLVLTMQQPCTGQVTVSKAPLELALMQFDAIDKG